MVGEMHGEGRCRLGEMHAMKKCILWRILVGGHILRKTHDVE